MILIIIMLLHQVLSVVCEAPAKGRKNANTDTHKRTNYLLIMDFNIQRMIVFLF